MLSIEHLSTSYQSFANGALTAIRGVRNLTAGVHLGLDAVLRREFRAMGQIPFTEGSHTLRQVSRW